MEDHSDFILCPHKLAKPLLEITNPIFGTEIPQINIYLHPDSDEFTLVFRAVWMIRKTSGRRILIEPGQGFTVRVEKFLLKEFPELHENFDLLTKVSAMPKGAAQVTLNMWCDNLKNNE